jgi:hypothetical protein
VLSEGTPQSSYSELLSRARVTGEFLFGLFSGRSISGTYFRIVRTPEMGIVGKCGVCAQSLPSPSVLEVVVMLLFIAILSSLSLAFS